MKFGVRDPQVFFFNKETNEVVVTAGYEEKLQHQLNRLISKRNSSKRKRLRKKLNSRINKLLNR